MISVANQTFVVIVPPPFAGTHLWPYPVLLLAGYYLRIGSVFKPKLLAAPYLYSMGSEQASSNFVGVRLRSPFSMTVFAHSQNAIAEPAGGRG